MLRSFRFEHYGTASKKYIHPASFSAEMVKQLIVLRMWANPKPIHRIRIFKRERPPVQANTNRAKRDRLAYALVIQACMLRVDSPLPVRLTRLLLNVRRQALKAFPKVGRDV